MIPAVHLVTNTLTIPIDFRYIRGYATSADVTITVENVDPDFPVAVVSDGRFNFLVTLYYCSEDLTLGAGSTTQIDAGAIIATTQLERGLATGASLDFTGTHDGILTRDDCPLVDFLCAEVLPSPTDDPSYSLYPSYEHTNCIDISTTHTLCDGKLVEFCIFLINIDYNKRIHEQS